MSYDGERTEDDYFRGWKLLIPPSRLTFESFFVKSGGNALKAVEAAIRRKRRLRDYAEFWCVCDIDDTSAADLASARQLAEANEIKLCTSNRCFEVWLLLHFEFTDAELCDEDDAINKVGRHIPDYGRPYKTIAFHELFALTDTALQNAQRLDALNRDNPQTNVYHLVRKLKQNLN